MSQATKSARPPSPGPPRVQVFRPSAGLGRRVVSISVMESAGGQASVLPTTGAVLGFQFHGRVRAGQELLSPAGVTGIQNTAREYGYLEQTASVLVRFTAQGASCLGVPASELTNQSLALDQLLGAARVRQVRDRLLEAHSAAERVNVIEQLLLGLPFVRDARLEHALGLLDAAPPEAASIAAVARSVSLSERQLERRFLERVGVSPKRYASLRRFERALALARTAPSLTAAALEAGYYDQSHFVRDVRRFAGTTPRQLARGAAGMSDLSNPL